MTPGDTASTIKFEKVVGKVTIDGIIMQVSIWILVENPMPFGGYNADQMRQVNPIEAALLVLGEAK